MGGRTAGHASEDDRGAVGTTSEPDRLFVYGTLAPGRSNHHVLEGIPGAWEDATLRGTLYPEGWGAVEGYPAIVPSEDGDEVAGFVFTSAALGDHWPRIDAFEGEGYLRTRVTVRVGGTHEVDAWVYALRRDEDGSGST